MEPAMPTTKEMLHRHRHMDSPPPYSPFPILSSSLPTPPSATTTTTTTRRRKLTAEEVLHRMAIAPPHVPHSSSSPLLSLPTAPFVQILGHVPPESVAALALTCRALHTSTLLRQGTVSKIGTDKAARLRLMQLLERDDDGHGRHDVSKGKKGKRYRYLCHGCAAYHPYDPMDMPKNYGESVEREQKKRNKAEGGKCRIADDEAVCLYNQYMIRSYHVQLALRSRVGGGGNIIPPSAFESRKWFKLGRGPDEVVRQILRARVLDGELLLWGYYAYQKWEYPRAGATYYRGGAAARPGGVTTNLERQEWRICPHHRVCAELPFAQPPARDARKMKTTTAGGGGDGAGGVETLDGLLLRNLPRAAMVGKNRQLDLGSSCCEHCDTDYTASLQCLNPLDFAGGTWLCVNFFRNLGSGRAPDDPKWRLAVEDASGTPPKLRKAAGKCSVQNAYHAAHTAEKTAAKEAALTTGLRRKAERTLDRARQKIAGILRSSDGDDESKKANASWAFPDKTLLKI